jgi:hypothetical protein
MQNNLGAPLIIKGLPMMLRLLEKFHTKKNKNPFLINWYLGGVLFLDHQFLLLLWIIFNCFRSSCRYNRKMAFEYLNKWLILWSIATYINTWLHLHDNDVTQMIHLGHEHLWNLTHVTRNEPFDSWLCYKEKEKTNVLLAFVNKNLFTKRLLPLVRGGFFANHFNEI